MNIKTERIVILSIFLLLISCRFRTPSLKEQQELISRNAVGNSLPSWMSVKRKIGNKNNTYMTSSNNRLAFRQKEEAKEAISLKKEVPLNQEPVNQEKFLQSKNEEGLEDRILKSCPNIGSSLTQAINTKYSVIRVKRYKELITKCPNSGDLWFLLGKDYLLEGMLIDAKGSLEKAISLDKDLTHAKKLLKAIILELNKN